MRLRGWLVAAILAGGLPVRSLGQVEEQPGEVRGVAFDSLAGRPLAGATVRLGPDGVDVRADDLGRYVLTGAPGRYDVLLSHPGLSTWTPLHHGRYVVLEAGASIELNVATASPATVKRRTCREGDGVVGGVVRDLLSLVPLPSSTVDVEVQGRAAPITIQTGSTGEFFACVETDRHVRVQARLGDIRSRAVALDPAPEGVRVRDLYVAASEPVRVSGRVVDQRTGEPVPDASVRVLGTRLGVLTRSEGSFLIRGVPPGGVQIAVERLGYGRSTVGIHAEGGDSLHLDMELSEEALAIDSMVVTVSRRTPESRRGGTRFDGLDRPQIEKLLPRSVGLDDLLRNAHLPSLRVRNVFYVTEVGYRRPGVCIETGRRSTMISGVCDMVEVYVNDVRFAEPELLLEQLNPNDIERVEVLSRQEASVRYAGTPRSRNGVLLLYTRGR